MNKTSIEWVKNPDGTQGYTWNPITGCLNNCAYCYARKLANGRLRSRYLANENIAPIGTMIVGAAMGEKALKDPFYPRFWEDRLELPFSKLPTMRNWSAIAWAAIANSKRRGIFVCDMSDLFGIGIPEDWTRRVLEEIRKHENDRFYLLTKQPQNLIKFSSFPDNAWVGVTVTDFSSMYHSVQHLYNIEAKVKYISVEPLLASLAGDSLVLSTQFVDWVIIGAQTGSYKDIVIAATKYAGTMMQYGNKWTLQPPIKYVREIVEACDKAGMPVFLKENLKPLFASGEPKYWAIDNSGFLRQELPVCQKPQ